MMTLLFGCCQIETCAHDLDAVRAFLVHGLGGALAEQELARQIAALIPSDAYDVDHIDCGGAIFQVNRPSPTMAYKGNPSVHQRYLDERGPCVTNLNFFVDDVEQARELLTRLGAPTHIEGPSSAARALGDYGPDNTRAGADDRPFLFMGTRSLIGFDLEIMEPNFRRFSRQKVQFPAFIEPRPPGGDGRLVLNRLIVVVPDLDLLWLNLTRILAPASRSKPYAARRGPHGAAFRIGVGGIEIEFVAPSGDGQGSASSMAADGSGVVAIAFGADDPQPILTRCAGLGYAAEQREHDCVGRMTESSSHAITSRAVVGFDVVIEPAERLLPV